MRKFAKFSLLFFGILKIFSMFEFASNISRVKKNNRSLRYLL